MTAVGTCDVCGNEYGDLLTVTQGDRKGSFDSFECAAHAMAPACVHCGCKILGHGVQVGVSVYCCANCARADSGASHVADHA